MIQIPLTPEAFAAKTLELKDKQKIELTGHQGTIEKMGVKARYAYAEGLLTVDILEKPFFVTTEYCEEQLRGFLGVKA